MENKTIDSIIENLFYIVPLVHKKLLGMDLGGVTGSLSRLHLAIMGVLSEGGLPVSEIAGKLVIPKSQMTHLLDYLVSLSIVERQPDVKDRRVINISLTEHGKIVLKESKELIRQNIRSKLSRLTPAELKELSIALAKLKDIGSSLE
jgi:DNA-binding MarR family transcriptional regulator